MWFGVHCMISLTRMIAFLMVLVFQANDMLFYWVNIDGEMFYYCRVLSLFVGWLMQKINQFWPALVMTIRFTYMNCHRKFSSWPIMCILVVNRKKLWSFGGSSHNIFVVLAQIQWERQDFLTTRSENNSDRPWWSIFHWRWSRTDNCVEIDRIMWWERFRSITSEEFCESVFQKH